MFLFPHFSKITKLAKRLSRSGWFVPGDFRPVVRALSPKCARADRDQPGLCNRLEGHYYSHLIAALQMAHSPGNGLVQTYPVNDNVEVGV